MLALIVVSFANTFWITYSVYAQALNVAFTSVDLVSFAALVFSMAWFLAVLLRALSPQTLVISLSAIGMSEGFMEATPALDVYSSFPPSKLLRSIAREPKIVVSEGVADVVKRLEDKVGDKSLAASILALLGQVYDSWRKSVGILLQDRYDISVGSRARYQLEETKLPKGFLSRYAGALALIAIVAVAALAIVWLQPTLGPAQTTTPTYASPQATATTSGPMHPAPPPTITTTSPHVRPAPPPTPTVSKGG